MKPEFELNGRRVGEHYPPLVIAEIGINHEGSLDVAIAMADAACKAGAEVVKHQTHVVEDEMTARAREVIPGNASESIYDIMARCALSERDEMSLKDYVEWKGMCFISTPFSREAANRLARMDIPAYKIGSGECNNYPLVDHIASFGKPVILSTGMNDIAAVSRSVAILERRGVPYALLHTTNLYPTPAHLVRLGAMTDLAEAFPRAVIGLSDHTTGNYACLAAVALGASVLERHFTDRMDRPGPDIVNSMDPLALKELIIGSEQIFLMRGGTKMAVPEEQVTMDFAFATVVTTRPIAAGETLTKENIWVKRPGTGQIRAEHFEQVLGSIAKRDLAHDEHLDWSDFSATKRAEA